MLKKVLIIEDDLEMLDTVTSFLDMYGLSDNNILRASDPIEGLEIFKQKREEITLIICDYYMPISNGAEFCELLKKNKPNLGIVLQTGDSNIRLKDLQDVDQVLHKPYSYNAFKKVLDEICSDAPKFDFGKYEKRISNGKHQCSMINFLSTNTNMHALILDESVSGCKLVMKPTINIQEGAVLEYKPASFNLEENHYEVDKVKKAKIVWFKLLSLDVCVVGLNFK